MPLSPVGRAPLDAAAPPWHHHGGATMTDPAPLLANLDAFVAFARRRTGDTDLATEVVQEALAKALASADALEDDARLLPWFWRILRNTIHDARRARGRLSSAVDPEDLPASPPDDDATRTVCACLEEAIASLPERERTAVRRVDLAGEDAATVAAGLGLTPAHLKVIRHRARTTLRERLGLVCRTCAAHGCLDCTCAHAPRQAGAAPHRHGH